jgi:short-subunit dehydrogenase
MAGSVKLRNARSEHLSSEIAPTGASKGCGAVIARTLARAGMDIAIIARNEADLRRTKDEIEAVGRACLVVRADLSTTEGAKRAGEEALNAAENWDSRRSGAVSGQPVS